MKGDWSELGKVANPNGTAAVEFTGVSGQDVRVEVDRVTVATGQFRQVQVGTASRWLDQVGDYKVMHRDGSVTESHAMGLHDGGSLAARSGQLEIGGAQLDGSPKWANSWKADAGLFKIDTTDPITRVRVIDSTGHEFNGNGTIYCYERED